MPWPAPPPKFPSSPTSTSFQTWGGKRLRVRAGKQPTIKRTSNQCVSDKLLPVSFDFFVVPPTFLDWQIHSFRLEKLLFFRFFRSGKYQERIEEEFKEEQELKPLIKRFLSFVIISERLLWPNLWLSNSFLCSLLMFSQCSLWPVVLYCCLIIFPLAFDSFYWDITCTIAQPLEG